MNLTRRATLGLGMGMMACMSGCGDQNPVTSGVEQTSGSGPVRVDYGSDPSQFAMLHRPVGRSRATVVVIHGGFWKAAYGLDLGTPLAEDLAARGFTALNVEYRRVGNGGGFPATLDDISTAINHLATLEVDTSTVITLGHSAGGHLATWAAGRSRLPAWPEQVKVTQVISQAGVLDLAQAARDHLGSDAVAGFMGGATDLAAADPTAQIPLDVPVWCVHGREDTNVPLTQSQDYVARATAAGATATLHEIDGDHFVLIDPSSPAWRVQLGIIDSIA